MPKPCPAEHSHKEGLYLRCELLAGHVGEHHWAPVPTLHRHCHHIVGVASEQSHGPYRPKPSVEAEPVFRCCHCGLYTQGLVHTTLTSTTHVRFDPGCGPDA